MRLHVLGIGSGEIKLKYSYIEARLGKTLSFIKTVEPRHDKTNKMSVRPAKIQISLGTTQSDQSLRCPHEESLGP